MNNKIKYIIIGIVAVILIAFVYFGVLFKPTGRIVETGKIEQTTGYPDFNSNEPIPMELAVREVSTITPSDPIKDLGGGKYQIGDSIIDTTDNVPDIAVAYGGMNKTEGFVDFINYIYFDQATVNFGKYDHRTIYVKNGEKTYSDWLTSLIDPLSKKIEIKPGLYYKKILGGLDTNSITGIEYKIGNRTVALIIPESDMIKYFGCNEFGRNCKY